MPEDLKLEAEAEKLIEVEPKWRVDGNVVYRQIVPLFRYLRYYITLCAELRAERDRLKKELEWIPVSERLPKPQEDVHVWVIFDGYRMDEGEIMDSWLEMDGTWAMGSAKNYCVTHWRALPAPPAEKPAPPSVGEPK